MFCLSEPVVFCHDTKIYNIFESILEGKNFNYITIEV